MAAQSEQIVMRSSNDQLCAGFDTASVLPELDEEYFSGLSNSNMPSQPTQPPRPLDEDGFPSFAPLLHACQGYAVLSGCRFSLKAFEGIECKPGTHMPVVSDLRAGDTGPFLSAKLRAISSINKFAERLRSGEADLLQDLTRAFDLAIKESARNSMIASCKAVDFFPPSPSPDSVDDQDCSWDEVGLASAPVIAQRLYNDSVHRLQDLHDGRNLTLVQAKTASFIVDFADELGVTLPQTPLQRTDMLEEFQRDLKAWVSHSASLPLRQSTFLEDAWTGSAGDLAKKVQGKADQWLAKRENREALLWSTTTVAMMGVVGIAAQTAISTSRATSSVSFSHRARARA